MAGYSMRWCNEGVDLSIFLQCAVWGFQQRSINHVVPASEDLLQYVVCLRSDGVVVHRVCDKRFATLDRACSLHTQLEIHIHILVIHGRISRHLVLPQLLHIVQLRPVLLCCKQLAYLFHFCQLRVAVEHEGVDHLAREVHRFFLIHVLRGELRKPGEKAFGRPVGRFALAVDGLMQQRVDDVRVPALRGLEGEYRRSSQVAELAQIRVCAQDQGMYVLEPAVLAEKDAQLEEPARAHVAFATLDAHGGVAEAGEQLEDALYAVDVLRVFGVVLLVPPLDARVQACVDFVWVVAEGRQTAEQECFFDALRVERQIRGRAKAAK
ncbi:hypothetical protein B5807_03024 [Epicoccum nigrum]|uniref:Uncharacterized protein n=1 Tax=Epicoccum nigrum TaxID=105696 RepID=A0A1Y2M8U7_EPING|nr:hypothetical protein B5807_03024 [Epicoccum nigrum]